MADRVAQRSVILGVADGFDHPKLVSWEHQETSRAYYLTSVYTTGNGDQIAFSIKFLWHKPLSEFVVEILNKESREVADRTDFEHYISEMMLMCLENFCIAKDRLDLFTGVKEHKEMGNETKNQT